MSEIKQPAVAGLFYPADADELRSEVRQFLAEAKPGTDTLPKALIAPHAGYIYSGPVAGSAYAGLKPFSSKIKRVILLAPAHRLGFPGLARCSAKAFRTPLGDIPVDSEAMAGIIDLPQVHLLDAAFTEEHSIEVHLPFLQECLEQFTLVPLLVSDADPSQVEEVLELLWGGSETLIVISSDLSHYLDYRSAKEMDEEATRAIETLHPEALGRNNACGRIPIKGLLLVAKQYHLRAKTVDLRNSGDTAGPRNQVVGYGAYVFI
ncbi:MAG: AmmeMemoRadiSam system protein B [Candidatus Sedimenticola sp. (ex Thyasira tokunagai)]